MPASVCEDIRVFKRLVTSVNMQHVRTDKVKEFKEYVDGMFHSHRMVPLLPGSKPPRHALEVLSGFNFC